MPKDIVSDFYKKKETAHKIAKILAEENFTIADAEEVLAMVTKSIKLSSIVKCFDLEVNGFE